MVPSVKALTYSLVALGCRLALPFVEFCGTTCPAPKPVGLQVDAAVEPAGVVSNAPVMLLRRQGLRVLIWPLPGLANSQICGARMSWDWVARKRRPSIGS